MRIHLALLLMLASASTARAHVVSPGDDGHITVHATCATGPMHIDGKLDEPVYTATEPIGNFVQQEPDEGKPATEKTESWVGLTPVRNRAFVVKLNRLFRP